MDKKIEKLNIAKEALNKVKNTTNNRQNFEEFTVKFSKADATAISELADEIDAEYELWLRPDSYEFRKKAQSC